MSMKRVNPAFYENGQYLLEVDPQDSSLYSQAAQDAQAAKWRRLMQNRAPVKALPRPKLAVNGSNPPLYRLGIPFTNDYMFAYAQRHHLKMKMVSEKWRFGGKDELDFADITDAHLEDEKLRMVLRSAAVTLVVQELARQCVMSFEIGRPFSLEWDGIISLWSNYNMHDRYLRLINSPERYRKIEATLLAAMNEEGGSNEIQWWFDWDNNVNVFTSVD